MILYCIKSGSGGWKVRESMFAKSIFYFLQGGGLVFKTKREAAENLSNSFERVVPIVIKWDKEAK